jgi:DNA polymerase IV
VGELCGLDLTTLQREFGRYGSRLHDVARGIDDSSVVPNRPTQSISAEDTFESDVTLAETEPMIRRLAEKVWLASRKESRIARTVVLKLKTREFKILTRSHTPALPQVLSGIDRYSPVPTNTSGLRPRMPLSSSWCWTEQFS